MAPKNEFLKREPNAFAKCQKAVFVKWFEILVKCENGYALCGTGTTELEAWENALIRIKKTN